MTVIHFFRCRRCLIIETVEELLNFYTVAAQGGGFLLIHIDERKAQFALGVDDGAASCSQALTLVLTPWIVDEDDQVDESRDEVKDEN